MKPRRILPALLLALLVAAPLFAQATRPPAVPLVVHDPYFSLWSPADKLTDAVTCHWTGKPHSLCGMARIDGKAYRFLGAEPKSCEAMKQLSLQVLPMRTIYRFEAAGIRLTVRFTTPTLPGDLDVLSRPATYVNFEAASIDGAEHAVDLYFDHSAALVVNDLKQDVRWSRPKIDGLITVSFGSVDQPVLKNVGDDRRIDWGYSYLAAPTNAQAMADVLVKPVDRSPALEGLALPWAESDETGIRSPRESAAACALPLGKVGPKPVARYVILAYDDIYSIEYLGQKLRPYWRRNGAEAADMLREAARQHDELEKRCEAFDRDFMADLTRVGGAGYANLCALAYRQAVGGHKLCAGPEGRPMLFAKECFSNGCIATVDVIYPAAPVFALTSPALLKATMTPVLEYALTPRWKFPFAPHDLGTYPKANGQVYGGGERTEKNQMPVEESGNMLILAALVAKIDGDTKYIDRYWPLWDRWAEYLKQKGLDPENQLCTDDFAGHLAHNANLSIKAIVALGAYARLCEQAGRKDRAAEYRGLAEKFAAGWPKLAADGDHYRLAFDRPGTWSQKYNLVWDKLLGLKLFDPQIARTEVAYYKTKLAKYGLPLDNRATYTKTDWEVWTATLAESREDFDALMNPVYAFVDATPQRVPLTDWYLTQNAKKVGFQARPVIGGVFIKMLSDEAAWAKWVKAGAR